MDLSRTYNNSNLERKRQALLRQQADVARLREHKQESAGPGRAASAIKKAMKSLSPDARARLDALLDVVARRSDLLDQADRFVPALAGLADWQLFWIDDPSTWAARSHNAGRCFASLARHLLAKYPVPPFLDGVWLDPGAADFQEWFVHVGQGGNLRKAGNLPVALTKAQAHALMEAPARYSVIEAVRWGQVRGLGGDERCVEAVNGSFLGRSFFGLDAEAVWASVLLWLVANQTMDARQTGPVLDYIKAQKFDDEGHVWVDDHFEHRGPPQPGFSMKGRTVDGLLRQTQAWHRRLAGQVRGRPTTQWPPSGIGPLVRREGEHRVFRVDELLTSAALTAEGRAMHHCVGSYAHSCVSRRCAIFSIHSNDRGERERMLTVEVDLKSRTIVQARKARNARATELDLRILSVWATQESLTVGRWVRR